MLPAICPPLGRTSRFVSANGLSPIRPPATVFSKTRSSSASGGRGDRRAENSPRPTCPDELESSSEPIQCDSIRTCESPSRRGGGNSKRASRKSSMTTCLLGSANTDPQFVEQGVEHVHRSGDEILGKVLDEEVTVGQEVLEARHVAPKVELTVAEQGLAQVEHESVLGVDVLDVAAHRVRAETVEHAVEKARAVVERVQVADEVDRVEVDSDGRLVDGVEDLANSLGRVQRGQDVALERDPEAEALRSGGGLLEASHEAGLRVARVVLAVRPVATARIATSAATGHTVRSELGGDFERGAQPTDFAYSHRVVRVHEVRRPAPRLRDADAVRGQNLSRVPTFPTVEIRRLASLAVSEVGEDAGEAQLGELRGQPLVDEVEIVGHRTLGDADAHPSALFRSSRRRPAEHHSSAVHEVDLARHVGGLVAGEVDRRRCEILWLAHSTKRDPVEHELLRLRVVEALASHVAEDVARRQAVDADS